MYVRQLFRIYKAKKKRSQHNIAMRDKCWRRRAFRQYISHYFVCVQWNKFNLNNSCFDHLTNKVSSDINVPRKLSAHCVFAHSHTCQVICSDFSCGRLLVSEISESVTQIHYLVGCLAGCDELSFCCRRRDIILSVTFSWHGSTVYHQHVACVWSSGVCVACQISIDQPPQIIYSTASARVRTMMVSRASHVSRR